MTHFLLLHTLLVTSASVARSALLVWPLAFSNIIWDGRIPNFFALENFDSAMQRY